MPTETFTISGFGFARWYNQPATSAEAMLVPLYNVAYHGYPPMGLGPAGGEVVFESASWPYPLVIPGDREFPGYKRERVYPSAAAQLLFTSQEFCNRLLTRHMRPGQSVTLTTPAAAGAASSIAYVNTQGALWPPYGGTMHNLLKTYFRVGLPQTMGIPTG